MDDTDAVDTTTWSMVDHICRTCGGRIVASADGARVRCAECGSSATGGHEEICWCGALPAGSRARLKCVRNEHPTPESPSGGVAIECGEAAASQPTAVTYFQVDGCDKRFFRCTILRATLSTAGCSENWRRAQRVPADQLGFASKCQGCPIGAMHAGAASVYRSNWFMAQICPRTRRWASRIVSNLLGISAYNRAREFLAGRNAKNTVPQLVLESRRLGVIVGYGSPDQRFVELRDDLTRDTIELAVQTLRVATGRVAFCAPRGGPSITTADLARQFAPERPPSHGIIAHAAKPRPRRRAGTGRSRSQRVSRRATVERKRRRRGAGAHGGVMNAPARAHGLASQATLAWLHSRGNAPAISLHRPPDHAHESDPRGRDAIENTIGLVLACVVGEMLHLGADGRHLAADRDDVRRALALATQLGDGDPVAHLEPIFDDSCATLTSPKVRNTVTKLAGALVRAPGGTMSADDVLERIILGMAAELPIDADQTAHPRRIFVR
jgi:hypothetical protein